MKQPFLVFIFRNSIPWPEWRSLVELDLWTEKALNGEVVGRWVFALCDTKKFHKRWPCKNTIVPRLLQNMFPSHLAGLYCRSKRSSGDKWVTSSSLSVCSFVHLSVDLPPVISLTEVIQRSIFENKTCAVLSKCWPKWLPKIKMAKSGAFCQIWGPMAQRVFMFSGTQMGTGGLQLNSDLNV